MIKRAWPFLFLIGCQQPAKDHPAPPPAPSAPAAVTASSSAPHELERLDVRKPVPLLPVMAHHQKQSMREHLEAVQQIVAALAIDDFAGAEKAAKRIGFSESMGRMCEHLGAGAPGFTEHALAFHHTADGISLAAARRDKPGVLAALSATLSACTTCHASYKQQLVVSLPN